MTLLRVLAALAIAVGFVAAAAADERTERRVVVDAAAQPWSAIGRVNVAGFDRRSHCTGTLVAAQVMVTAAHCLHLRGRMVEPGEVHFLAGYQRGDYRAHSVGKRIVVGPGFVHGEGALRANLEKDWALVVLEKAIGRSVGWLPMLRRLKSGGEIMIAGYPRDRAHVLSVDSECKFPRAPHVNFDTGVFKVKCAVLPGDSGGPLLYRREGRPRLVGILVASGAGRDFGLVLPGGAFSGTLRDLVATAGR